MVQFLVTVTNETVCNMLTLYKGKSKVECDWITSS